MKSKLQMLALLGAIFCKTCLFASQSRPILSMQGEAVQLVIDLGGGSISDFRLGEDGLNPLKWDSWHFKPDSVLESPLAPRSMGHFLCLDRWGPATENEAEMGMGWHGEASRSWWSIRQAPTHVDGRVQAQMAATLPLAGLEVLRTIRLHDDQPIFTVREEVKNTRHIGRIYNIVQHPTIGPPFLDESTVVDANGTRGFMQETPGLNFEKPEVRWPDALKKDGTQVNLRHLKDDASPAVVSFIIEDAYGWVTAINASEQLLIGYLWPRADYPWFNVWRHVVDGKPFARGLEFGTTGLHQPGPVLVEKGKIFDRHLFRFIDAGQTQTFSYANFLIKIPQDFNGVESVLYDGTQIVILERGRKEREMRMEVGPLFVKDQ